MPVELLESPPRPRPLVAHAPKELRAEELEDLHRVRAVACFFKGRCQGLQLGRDIGQMFLQHRLILGRGLRRAAAKAEIDIAKAKVDAEINKAGAGNGAAPTQAAPVPNLNPAPNPAWVKQAKP